MHTRIGCPGYVGERSIPNITGATTMLCAHLGIGNDAGALTSYAFGSTGPQNMSFNGDVRIDFNASKSNSIYGYESLQPKAFQILIIIKV